MKTRWSSLLPLFAAACVVILGGTTPADSQPIFNGPEAASSRPSATLPAALATKSPYPALDVGAPGAWDQYYVYKPWIIKHGSRYEMWYVADPTAGAARTAGATRGELPWKTSQIGLAYSEHGLTWYRYEGNPVIKDPGMGAPCVVYGDWRDGKGPYYKMWYRFFSPESRGLLTKLAYATSQDGIHWADHGVIAGASPNDQRAWGFRITSPSVLHLPDAPGLPAPYLMYYYAAAQDVRLAISQDGIHWQPRGPVLEKGKPGTWDSVGSGDGSVFYLDGRLHMIYAGAGMLSVPGRGELLYRALGYAVSDDGVHWYRSDRIVLAGSNDPEAPDFNLVQPTWLVDGDRVRIYYAAYPSGASFHNIGCAKMPVSELLRGPLPTEKSEQ